MEVVKQLELISSHTSNQSQEIFHWHQRCAIMRPAASSKWGRRDQWWVPSRGYQLLRRKASSSIWPEKVETLYDARKAKQLFSCVWFPQQPSPHTHHFLDTTLRASSKRHRRRQGVFHVVAYSLEAANITSSCGVCHKPLDLGSWWRKGFRNGMMPIYRSRQWIDGQGLATAFQTDLPWFGKLVF